MLLAAKISSKTRSTSSGSTPVDALNSSIDTTAATNHGQT